MPLGDVFGAIVHLPCSWSRTARIALRRVYGGGWWPTLVPEALLLLVYGIMVGVAAAAFLTTSLSMTPSTCDDRTIESTHDP